VFVPILLVLAAASPTADTTLTLAEARALARDSHPRLLAARGAVDAARGAAREAASLRDPTLVIAREQTGARVWQNTVTLDQPLDVLGHRTRRAAVAEARVDVADGSLAAAAREVVALVTAAYARAQAALRRARLADSVQAAFDRAVRILDARVAAGDASGYEARRLRLEQARQSGQRAELEAERLEAFATLATLIGRDPETIVLDPNARVGPVTVGVSADSLLTLATAVDGAVVVAAAEASVARAELTRARGDRVPVPTLGLGYKEERGGSSETFRGYIAQLSLPLPVWGGRGAAVSAASAMAARMDAQAQAARLQARRAVLSTTARLDGLAQHLSALDAALEADAERAGVAADSAFAGGAMTLLEWLDAVRAFADAGAERASVAADYLAALAELERLTGLTLFSRTSR